MDSIVLLEDSFVDKLIKEQTLVSVFLKNSIRLKGHLICHDQETISLHSGITQIIYKKSISAICPEMVFETY